MMSRDEVPQTISQREKSQKNITVFTNSKKKSMFATKTQASQPIQNGVWMSGSHNSKDTGNQYGSASSISKTMNGGNHQK